LTNSNIDVDVFSPTSVTHETNRILNGYTTVIGSLISQLAFSNNVYLFNDIYLRFFESSKINNSKTEPFICSRSLQQFVNHFNITMIEKEMM